MARVRGRAIFRFQPAQGTYRTISQLSRAAKEMRTVLLREMRADSPEVVTIFEEYAPYDFMERDDYHLADHISVAISTLGRITAEVRAEAISPENRFDYLDVTRFGHRGTLTPRHRRWMKWTDGIETHYAKETAGYHPSSDWVEDAQPEADRAVADIAERAGRVIYTRLLT